MQDQFYVSEIDITYNPKIKASQRVKISNSQQAYQILRQSWDDNRINLFEEFKIMLLNRANKVLGISTISKGGVHGTVVDPKVVFGIALKAMACGMVIAHNHPSGNLKPSPQDRSLTSKLIKAGKILDIDVLDHIIMTDESYHSFADSFEMT